MDRHSTWVERLRQAVLGGRGTTDAALRQAVEARAAVAGGRPGEASGSIPPDLADFVDKVIRHAWRITDGDVERLVRAGYSEDAIFELTIAAALGAGMGRLERGLAALAGEP
jgi:alkylhydroperoxidase family enzyme